MKIETIVVGAFESNCHIVHAPDGTLLVIDAGDDPSQILEYIIQTRCAVSGYLLTHGHTDHVSAVAAVCDRFNAPVTIHEKDAVWAFSPRNTIPPYYPAPRQPCGEIHRIQGNTTAQIGSLEVRTLWTPGHSSGSVCFWLPEQKVIFTGDTLFANSVGRTDFPGGSPSELQKSLRMLAQMDDDITVYPGHGPATTLGEENRSNFFLRGKKLAKYQGL